MTPDPQNSRAELEARLTALLLGELPADQANAVRELMAHDRELALLHERLKQAIELVRQTAASPAEQVQPAPEPLRLSNERREALLQRFKTVTPKQFARPRRKQSSWLVPLAAAAVLVLMLGAMLLPALSKAKSKAMARSGKQLARVQDAQPEDVLRLMRIIPASKDLKSVGSGESAAGKSGQHYSKPAQPAIVLPPSGTVEDGDAEDAGHAHWQAAISGSESAQHSRKDAFGAIFPGEARDNYTGLETPKGAPPIAWNGSLAGTMDPGKPPAPVAAPPSAATIVMSSPHQLGREAPLSYQWQGGTTAAQSQPKADMDFQDNAHAVSPLGGVLHGAIDPATGLPVSSPPPIITVNGWSGERQAGEKAGALGTDSAVGDALALKVEQPPVGHDLAANADVASGAPADGGGKRFYRIVGDGGGGRGFAVPNAPAPPRPEVAKNSFSEAEAAAQNGRVNSSSVEKAAGELKGYADTSAQWNFGSGNANVPPYKLDSSKKTDGFNLDEVQLARELPGAAPASGASLAPGQPQNGTSEFLGYDDPGKFIPQALSASAGSGGVQLPITAQLPRPHYRNNLSGENAPVEINGIVAGGAFQAADQSTKSGAGTLDRDGGNIPVLGDVPSLGHLERSRIVLPSATEESGEKQESVGYYALKNADPEDAYRAMEELVNRGMVQAKDNSVPEMSQGPITHHQLNNTTGTEGRAGAGDVVASSTLGPTLQQYQSNNKIGDAYFTADSETRRIVSLADARTSKDVTGKLAESEDALSKSSNGTDAKSHGTHFSGNILAQAELERQHQELAKPLADAAPVKPAAPPPTPQPEVQTRDNAFSTFSLNVSDVSFKLAAASLEKGVLPDPASIRTEEFINAFDYRDPEAPAGVPIAFAWDRARYPFAQNRDLLRFSLKTAAEGRQAGRPLNIVLLLDNSGSMERADRVRIRHEALRVLGGQLQAQDKFSVVAFARTARLCVDGVPGSQAAQAAEAVSDLTPEGGTNLEDAMNLAYQTALRHYLPNGINRVVLLTDGAANLGDVDPDSLKKKVDDHRKQGIALDCFGIGWEGYNDDLLEVLTRNGNGRYGFMNTPEEAASEFASQLAGALHVAASDVKVQVEFNPNRVTAYRQLGYAKHQLTKEQFRDNTVAAAEIAAQETGNALYLVEVNPAGDGPLATVRVRYKVPGTTDYREYEWPVLYTANAVALEKASPATRLSGTASAFSEWLAASPYAAEVTPDRLLGCLSGVPEVYGADGRPKKLEWMIRQAKSILGK
jgi:Mg-chelatase subunit ChlD